MRVILKTKIICAMNEEDLQSKLNLFLKNHDESLITDIKIITHEGYIYAMVIYKSTST